jgi:hypothetical protein
MNKLAKVRFVIIAIIVIALGVGCLWLLVPPPSGVTASEFYSPLGTPVTLVDTVVAIGSGVLFLVALRNFKPQLKPAYRWVAAGSFSVGILTIVYPYIEYYDLWDNVWFNMSSYTQYLVGSVLMYFGARSFLKILGLKSRATSFGVMVLAVALVSSIHAVMPHADSWPTFSELKYDLFEVAVVIPVLFYGAASYIMFKIRRRAGAEYRWSFGWLAVGLGIQMASAITILVLDTIGYDNWYFNSRLYEIPTIAGDVAVLIAAYYFNIVGLTHPAHAWWHRLFGHSQLPATSLDIVVLTAGMVSNTAAIDPILERMRILTAQLTPGQTLSPSDEQELRQIYLDIEHYLVTKEPLRSFTQDELRATVTSRLELDTPELRTFWPSVATKAH